MKILGILPVSIGGRLTMSSIFDGFTLSGHDVVIYDELKDKYVLSDNDNDYIIGYDFSALNLKDKYSLHLPSINYFSDVIESKTSGPDWQRLLPLLNNSDNYTFYWDRELIKKENYKNIFYLPHFVNTNIYYDKKLNPECDVMFAGRLDTDYRLNLITDIVENTDIKFKWYAIEKHYIDALKRCKNKKIIEQIYSGFIDNEEDMSDAINKTKIVINMNSQGISSLNYRTIQTIACGKLLISDERAELDLFDNKIPTYNDLASLKKCIMYYLENNNSYDEIVKYTQQICVKNHNSIKGINYILDCIKYY